MAVVMQDLTNGIVTVMKKFEDGSVVLFHATASDEVLRSKHLMLGKIYNMDTMKQIDEAELLKDEYSIYYSEDSTKMSALDLYMNRGVAGECFNT